MKWRGRWYFIKPWKKFSSNLFSTWEKYVSLNYGNFCRTSHEHENYISTCPRVSDGQVRTHQKFKPRSPIIITPWPWSICSNNSKTHQWAPNLYDPELLQNLIHFSSTSLASDSSSSRNLAIANASLNLFFSLSNSTASSSFPRANWKLTASKMRSARIICSMYTWQAFSQNLEKENSSK